MGNSAQGHMTPAPVVGAGNGEVGVSRTSSTCYLAREDLPTICTKVCALTGCPVEHLELPQVGRYRGGEFYKAHYDAFDTSSPDGRRFAQNGGQRVATVLVYLNDVARGGCTSFSKLGLSIQPKKGTALVFFPASLDGMLDQHYLHAADRRSTSSGSRRSGSGRRRTTASRPCASRPSETSVPA